MASGIHEIAAGVGELPAAVALATVKAIKEIANAEAVKVAGGDRSLSNAGRRRLATRDTFKGGGARTQVTVFATPAAQWAWMTTGTRPHLIGAGRSNRRTGNYAASRFTSRKRLRLPGGWVTGPVVHRGTAPKRAWTRVQERAMRVVPEIAAKEFKKVMR